MCVRVREKKKREKGGGKEKREGGGNLSGSLGMERVKVKGSGAWMARVRG